MIAPMLEPETSPHPPPILSIVGEAVALGPERRDLVPRSRRWLNDFAVMAPLGATLGPVTDKGAVRPYEESEAAPDQVWFTIYERATSRPLGITGLRDIDPAHGTAEFVIFLGEKDCWGRGYGTETARLMLDYGFTALGLDNIMLKVYDFNVRGIRAYRRAGFREFGPRRAAYRLGAHVADVILMDCLATEFRGSVLGQLLGDTDRPPV